MLLSTSSSDPAGARKWAYLIRGTLFSFGIFLIALEALTRFGFQHVSRIESRIANDFGRSRNIRPGPHKSVLLLGNSLLLEGLQYDRIQREMQPDNTQVSRFAIEGTHYFAWYFGIRRLLSEGSRPDLIVLCLSPLHLISDMAPNDYAAYYLLQIGDLPDLMRATGSGLTAGSSWAIAHYSLFYAGRNNIRNFVLNKSFPSYGELLHGLMLTPGKYPSRETTRRIAEERLRRLAEVGARARVHIALLIPPALSPQGEAELLQAGRNSGVSVLLPVSGGTLGAELFADGYHLNPQGAGMFTDKLEETLRTALAKPGGAGGF